MEIIKQITYDHKVVQNKLAIRIASLELQLANEQAAKEAIIKYAEELEQKIDEFEKEVAKDEV